MRYLLCVPAWAVSCGVFALLGFFLMGIFFSSRDSGKSPYYLSLGQWADMLSLLLCGALIQYVVQGPLWISSYGVCIVAGVILYCLLFYYCTDEQTKQVLPFDQCIDVLILCIFAAFVGGKLLFFIEYGWRVKNMWSGFSLLGSVLGVLSGLWMYCRATKLSFFFLLDVVALYAPATQAVARWGCYFAGCCYGYPLLHAPWYSVVYTDIYTLAPRHISLFPAQLVMSGLSCAIFVFLYWGVYRFVRPGKGFFISWYLILEPLARFSIDFLRADRGVVVWYTFTYYQCLSLSLCLLGVGSLAVAWRNYRDGV